MDSFFRRQNRDQPAPPPMPEPVPINEGIAVSWDDPSDPKPRSETFVRMESAPQDFNRILSRYCKDLKTPLDPDFALTIKRTPYTEEELAAYAAVVQGTPPWHWARAGPSGTSVAIAMGIAKDSLNSKIREWMGYVAAAAARKKSDGLFFCPGRFDLAYFVQEIKRQSLLPPPPPRTVTVGKGADKYMNNGTKHEPTCAALFFKYTGYAVEETGIIINNELPELKVSLDRRIISDPSKVKGAELREDGNYYLHDILIRTPPVKSVLECKVSWFKLYDDMKIEHDWQMQGEMFVDGAEEAYYINLHMVDEYDPENPPQLQIWRMPFNRDNWEKYAAPRIREAVDAVERRDVNFARHYPPIYNPYTRWRHYEEISKEDYDWARAHPM
jgi:hypothetical protein